MYIFLAVEYIIKNEDVVISTYSPAVDLVTPSGTDYKMSKRSARCWEEMQVMFAGVFSRSR